MTDLLRLLPEVCRRVARGGSILDLHAGTGERAIGIARAFPRALVFAFDARPACVLEARRRAQEAGLGGRVLFAACDVGELPPVGAEVAVTVDAMFVPGAEALLAAIDRALTPSGLHVAFERVGRDSGVAVMAFVRERGQHLHRTATANAPGRSCGGAERRGAVVAAAAGAVARGGA